eukprot:18401-Heterococcus_DN1.PRE.4
MTAINNTSCDRGTSTTSKHHINNYCRYCCSLVQQTAVMVVAQATHVGTIFGPLYNTLPVQIIAYTVVKGNGVDRQGPLASVVLQRPCQEGLREVQAAEPVHRRRGPSVTPGAQEARASQAAGTAFSATARARASSSALMTTRPASALQSSGRARDISPVSLLAVGGRELRGDGLQIEGPPLSQLRSHGPRCCCYGLIATTTAAAAAAAAPCLHLEHSPKGGKGLSQSAADVGVLVHAEGPWPCCEGQAVDELHVAAVRVAGVVVRARIDPICIKAVYVVSDAPSVVDVGCQEAQHSVGDAVRGVQEDLQLAAGDV